MNWSEFIELHKDKYCFELKIKTPKGRILEIRNHFNYNMMKKLLGIALHNMEDLDVTQAQVED